MKYKIFLKKVFLIAKPAYKKYGRYATIVFFHTIKRQFYKQPKNTFLFILSPPFCGSTLLTEILSSSTKVSSNNTIGTREGQKLPTTLSAMYDPNKRWDSTCYYDWEFIKKEWLRYWDITKPILLEKSPPNIVRATAIENHFQPSVFIIFVRNPYAHVSSLMKRRGMSAKKAASFAIRCLHYQKYNKMQLKNTISISYETLTENPENVKCKIEKYFQHLQLNLEINKKFNAHNFKREKLSIQNLNDEKIAMLDAYTLFDINSIFEQHVPILDFFGYKIIA